MPVVIAKLLLKKLLLNPETKRRVVEALRHAASKSETKFDDAAVDAFAGMWDIIVPILVGKL